MSSIKKFRINGYDDICGDGVEFYFKIQDDDEKVMFNVCVGDDGIYYYPKGSQILSPAENENTRLNFKMISMTNIMKLFEAIQTCDWFDCDDKVNFKISNSKGQVIISKSDEEPDSEDQEED